MQRAADFPFWNVFAPRPGEGSLQDQLCRFLRDAVVGGTLPAGARLPATRALAADLGLARNTVSIAYERLVAEGLLCARHGSGTFVSDSLARGAPAAVPRRLPRPSGRVRAVMATPAPPRSLPGRPLTPGLPDLDLFPHRTWARLSARYWRTRPALGYPDGAGLPALREAIAGYVGATRGVSCTADRVVVTAGTQSAVLAAALALADPGEPAWVEDPGYSQSLRALRLAGLAAVPVPVEDDGLAVDAGRRLADRARLVVVSPSHQYPLGVTLSLARRLALLEWAAAADAWVVEDDYDGEYRYAGQPVQALASLDRDGRVIYVGTLSKLLAPGLRLGFMIVPDLLVDAFRAVRDTVDQGVAHPLQAVCAEFIGDGHLGTHIRRTRTVYAERRAALLAALEPIAAFERVTGADAGLHLVAHLPDGEDDRALSDAARAAGLGVKALSHFRTGDAPRAGGGLLLGFAVTPAERMAASLAPVRRWLRANA